MNMCVRITLKMFCYVMSASVGAMMPRLEELEHWLSFLCLFLVNGQCSDLSSTVPFKDEVLICFWFTASSCSVLQARRPSAQGAALLLERDHLCRGHMSQGLH